MKSTLLFVFVLLGCLLVAVPVIAQDATPEPDAETCETVVSDLAPHIRRDMLQRDERLEDLRQILATIAEDGISQDEVIEKMMYWVVLADTIMTQRDIEYPDCLEYNMIDRAYKNTIDSMYAAAGQGVLILHNVLTELESDNVNELFRSELKEVEANLLIWNLFYEDMGG